ncbi:hypothetical protein L6452_15054 [Arctium lappa]|uniref:Uncharacterized protein n=1 Tax=Arctium lappa TaxID=4217 RepID=A0ACB9CMP6_ARCLA|nr:hypothetical protein L6452_15054 [Arctium lappa]
MLFSRFVNRIGISSNFRRIPSRHSCRVRCQGVRRNGINKSSRSEEQQAVGFLTDAFVGGGGVVSIGLSEERLWL